MSAVFEYELIQRHKAQLQALRDSRQSLLTVPPDTTPEIDNRVESSNAEIDERKKARETERARCFLKEEAYKSGLLISDSKTLLALDGEVRLHQNRIAAFTEKIKALEVSRDALLAERKTILETRARIVEENRIITICNASKDESVKLAETLTAGAGRLREIAQTVIHERDTRTSADNFKRLDDTQRVVKEIFAEFLETIRRASFQYGTSARSERDVAATFLEKQ